MPGWRRSRTATGITPILVRAGGTKPFLSHLRWLRDEHGLQVQFSVGFTMTEQIQQAILALPETAWTPAVQAVPPLI